MAEITPLLWFTGEAEEATKFYASIFGDSKIANVSHYGEAGPGEPGTAMMVDFELAGRAFVALNGGDGEDNASGMGARNIRRGAIALFVSCETQAEVDRIWDRLTEGGEIVQCGWLIDRYGVAWNIVPAGLSELLGNPDREKAERAMRAMLQMKKLDINELRRASGISE